MTRIRANTLALSASFFVTAALGLVQFKIVTNSISEAAVGAWLAVVGIGALINTLSELGLPQVIIRYGAKFDAQLRTCVKHHGAAV